MSKRRIKKQLLCPKNSLNLRIKTQPVTLGSGATVYVRFFGRIYINCSYCGICSCRDMLSFFYAEIRITFGDSVWKETLRQSYTLLFLNLIVSLVFGHQSLCSALSHQIPILNSQQSPSHNIPILNSPPAITSLSVLSVYYG